MRNKEITIALKIKSVNLKIVNDVIDWASNYKMSLELKDKDILKDDNINRRQLIIDRKLYKKSILFNR